MGDAVMTKAELITALADFPDDALICIASEDDDEDLVYIEAADVRQLDPDDGDLGFVKDQVFEALRNGKVVVVFD